MSIMVVENDPQDQMLFAMAAADGRHRVDVEFANNGPGFFTRMHQLATERHLPDVVVLDLRMPQMTGHDVLATLAADHALDQVPVVVMSSSRREVDVNASMDLGALAHQVKPSSYQELVSFIDSLDGAVAARQGSR